MSLKTRRVCNVEHTIGLKVNARVASFLTGALFGGTIRSKSPLRRAVPTTDAAPPEAKVAGEQKGSWYQI